MELRSLQILLIISITSPIWDTLANSETFTRPGQNRNDEVPTSQPKPPEPIVQYKFTHQHKVSNPNPTQFDTPQTTQEYITHIRFEDDNDVLRYSDLENIMKSKYVLLDDFVPVIKNLMDQNRLLSERMDVQCQAKTFFIEAYDRMIWFLFLGSIIFTVFIFFTTCVFHYYFGPPRPGYYPSIVAERKIEAQVTEGAKNHEQGESTTIVDSSTLCTPSEAENSLTSESMLSTRLDVTLSK